MGSVVFPSAKGKNAANAQSAGKTNQPLPVTQPGPSTKSDKKNKKELKQQSSVESVNSSNVKSTKKGSVEAIVPPAATAQAAASKKGVKEIPKTNSKVCKQSNEDIRDHKSEEETKKAAINNARITKAAVEASELLKEQKKKGKKTIPESNVAFVEVTQSATKTKKEKKKIKYEYADPNYKINKFDLLDEDEDEEEYYLESSDEEEIIPPSPAIKRPVAPVKLETVPPTPKNNAKVNKTIKDVQPVIKNVPATAVVPKVTAIKTEKSVVKEKTPQPQQKGQKVIPQPEIVKQPIDEIPMLSKRQQKKLLQKQKLEAKLALDNSVQNAENMAKSLNDSMSRLHLNPDTTIEFAKDQAAFGSQVCGYDKILVVFLIDSYHFIHRLVSMLASWIN